MLAVQSQEMFSLDWNKVLTCSYIF